ncbi:hypothetical protein ES705_40221 [subsurface metagenome]
MDKQSKLIKLFSEAFEISAFDKSQKCRFFCEKKESCKVTNIDPKYPGAIGDDNTDIMLIAEAPSASGGYGAHNGGKIENIEENKKSPLYDLIDFIKNNYHTIPYFTDLIKCGVSKQKNKSKLRYRKKNCMEKFLMKEINIIKPKIIFCIGKSAYEALVDYQEKEKIDSYVQIKYLVHYSRQANFNLSIEDKKEIIWKIQAGLIGKEQIKNRILELSYIKDILSK